MLLFSAGITFLFKFPFSYHFLGLEYEDSYIYNISARQLLEHIYPISFLTDGINAGSLANPISTVTYGGHFITYPVFVSWAYQIFGYNIYLPSFLNTFIEFLTILILSISFKKLFGFEKHWFIPGLIYCLAPAMNLFGNTHLSETFSSFIVLMCILSFFYYFQSTKLNTILIFSICFITAITTKRENLVLLSLFIIFSLYKVITEKQRRIFNLLPLIASLLLLIVYVCLIQNVFLIEKNESIDISTLTFSFSNFFNLTPVFVEALVSFKWFSIYILIFISALIYVLYKWQNHFFLISVVFLYFTYFLIYTFHYRSYYFIHFGDIKPFEALRYLNNFFVVSTIVISFGLCELFIIRKFKIWFLSIFSIFIIFSCISTFLLRKEFSAIETENRFSNPRLVLKYLSVKEKSVLIVDNILIFQLLGDKNLELVDINIIENFPDELKHSETYLFLSNFNKTRNFQYRFPEIYKKIQTMKKNEIIKFNNDDSLYKIE